MSTTPRRRDTRRPKAEDGGRRATASNPQSAIRIPQYLWVALVVAVLAGIPFILGKYFEFKCPDPYDSGCYVYSAEHVLKGARIGYEEKPSAQAGTLLMNMLGVSLSGFNETGSKVLQGLFQIGAFAFLFITIRRLYGTLAAVLSVTIASVYLSAPLIAKFGNVKEQFMIAFMITGICCFVYYQLSGRWWWAVLSGALLIWGPMFKQTGMSAIGAVGIFVLAHPILHHSGWRKVGMDFLLLVAGTAITMAPIAIWFSSMGTPAHYWPYSFIFEPAAAIFSHDKAQSADPEQQAQKPAADEQKPRGFILSVLPGYVSNSWAALGAAQRKEVALRVLRYYALLILPIALALGAIVIRAVAVLRRRGKGAKPDAPVEQDAGRFVPLFAVWWFLDMAFIWVSPHTYEQYFLPLNASSAVLGGYLGGMYTHRLQTDRDKTRWVVLGLLGLLLMLVLSWHIFFGIERSPYSGIAYTNRQTGLPERTKGYVQKWREVRMNYRYPWEQIGRYVREQSQPTDKIYVWGWIPGIYVQAQRMSSAPKAFEGTMHTLPAKDLSARVRELLDAFAKEPPKYIIDTQNRHFPWDRPPLQLWPNIDNGYPLLVNPPSSTEQIVAALLRTFDVRPDELTKDRFLRADKPDAIRRYDAAFEKALRRGVEPEEARRYEALQPLRSYLMQNYNIVGRFDLHILFKHK